MIFMRFPNGRSKALTFSYDDGVQQDKKLMEIFNKNGLKGTFNLNSCHLIEEERTYPEGAIHRPMARREAIEAYNGELGKNHEIAIHCHTHPFLDLLPRSMATYDVVKDRELLEQFFGRIIRGCAYPMGTYNDMTEEVLRGAGIAYARTSECTGNFVVPNGKWLRMPGTCHHNDPKLFEYLDKFLSDEIDFWNRTWLFYVWGHAYEFEQDNNWDRIEKFCDLAGGHEDKVWYATNIEIYDYVQAYNSLQFSMNGTAVRNPSSQPVWFDADGLLVCVEPGQTVKYR